MENNPYAPPVSSIQGTPELVRDEESGFRDLSGITGKLSVLLLIGLTVHILSIVAALMHVNLLSYGVSSANKTGLISNVSRLQIVTLGKLVLYYGTVIVFGRWIYLAQRNLPELGARNLRFWPGWSVGCFFIPIINLWAPCQAMNQLVRASRDPRTWELEDTPAVIIAWWVVWLVVRTVGNGVLRAAVAAKTASVPFSGTEADVALGALSVLLYVLAHVIVRRVWRDQSETYARMGDAPAQ